MRHYKEDIHENGILCRDMIQAVYGFTKTEPKMIREGNEKGKLKADFMNVML